MNGCWIIAFHSLKDETFNGRRELFFQCYIKSFHTFKFRLIALEVTMVIASFYFSLLKNFINHESSLQAMLLILNKASHMYLS